MLMQGASRTIAVRVDACIAYKRRLRNGALVLVELRSIACMRVYLYSTEYAIPAGAYYVLNLASIYVHRAPTCMVAQV